MTKFRATLTRSQWQALNHLLVSLLARHPLRDLEHDATTYALVSSLQEIALKVAVKLKQMEWAQKADARLSISQTQALAFASMVETGEFDEWAGFSLEIATRNSLFNAICQTYTLR